MYDQYAFSEEISSIGIFDFENNDQIVYQISNGEIISMNPNIVENNIQIGVYGIAPTIIDLHIPNDVLNSDNFFSYIIDNDSKFFLDTNLDSSYFF